MGEKPRMTFFMFSDIVPEPTLLQQFLQLCQHLVVAAIVGLFVSFFWFFFVPAIGRTRMFAHVEKQLQKIQRGQTNTAEAVETLKTSVFTDAMLGSAWAEYRKTLHRQEQDCADGVSPDHVVYRATTFAESAFTDRAIVDIPLKVEFFKHVPGMLTGLGIISTFAGLISGLQGFSATSDPARAQAQLHDLIAAVGNAFVYSGIAVFFAIIITFLEKSLYDLCASRLAKIRDRIDAIFEVGVGEEYLSNLSRYAEKTNTNIAHIRDHFITDITEMLREKLTRVLADRAEIENTRAIALPTEIGKAIASQLGEPIRDIASAVKNVTSTQGEAVETVLSNVLKQFTSKVESMFGDQLASVGSLLQQAAETMNESTARFDDLARTIGGAGVSAVESMGDRLGDILRDLDRRQAAADEKLLSFAESIKSLTANAQQDTQNAAQSMIGLLSNRFTETLATIDARSNGIQMQHQEAQNRFERNSETMMAGLSNTIETNVKLSGETNALLVQSIEKLSSVTSQAITGIDEGSRRLMQSVAEMTSAHRDVAATIEGTTQTALGLRSSAEMVDRSTAKMATLLEDYGRTREEIVRLSDIFKGIVDVAKRDAAVTSELTRSLEGAAHELSEAQSLAGRYVKEINEALVDAHEHFAEALTTTLRKANSVFNSELKELVDHVSGAVVDFGDLLDRSPAPTR